MFEFEGYWLFVALSQRGLGATELLSFHWLWGASKNYLLLQNMATFATSQPESFVADTVDPPLLDLPSSMFKESPPELPNVSVFLGAEPNPAASSSGARSEATKESSARKGRVLEILAFLREQALF